MKHNCVCINVYCHTYIAINHNRNETCTSLFRALTLHLYGVQHHHLLLRLFTALEMAEHRDFYDKNAPDFKDLVNEVKITVPP